VSSTAVPSFDDACCLFCDKPGSLLERLHDITTFELDRKVKDCATKSADTQLIAKLSSVSDLIALEAKYHTKCLANLYNRVRALDRKSSHVDVDDGDIYNLAFAQLVAYVEEYCSDTSVTPIFKLRDIVNLYSNRIHQLGCYGTVQCAAHALKSSCLYISPICVLMTRFEMSGNPVMHCVCHVQQKLCAETFLGLSLHLVGSLLQLAKQKMFRNPFWHLQS